MARKKKAPPPPSPPPAAPGPAPPPQAAPAPVPPQAAPAAAPPPPAPAPPPPAALAPALPPAASARAPPASPASTPELICKLKSIDFGGDSRTVVFPPSGHMSAFLALVNSLLLRGSFIAGKDASSQVSIQHFQLRMLRHYSRILKNLQVPFSREQVMDTLKSLCRQIDISVCFGRIDGIMSNTVCLDIFQHLRVHLYHLRVVDPQDAIVAPAIGSDYCEIFKALAPDEPLVSIPNADQAILDFIQGTGLTPFGLQQLDDAMENDEICVVWWNKAFHTVVKHDNDIYALQNDLRYFQSDILWKELKDGDDGQLCTSSFSPVVQDTQVQDEDVADPTWDQLPDVKSLYKEKITSALTGVPWKSDSAAATSNVSTRKCIKTNCQLEFLSELNLERHKQAHMNTKKDPMDTADIAKFWNELSEEDRKELMFIKDAPTINGINGDMIYQSLTKIGPDDNCFGIASKLLLIVGCSQKITSDYLFDAFIEASEAMAFSTDIHHSDYSILDRGLLLLSEVHDVIACCSYFLERGLVKKWFECKEDEALQNTAALLNEVVVSHKCGKDNCSLCFYSVVNHKRHEYVHSSDFDPKNDFLLNQDDIGLFWDNLTNDQVSQLLDIHDMRVQSIRGRKLIKILDKAGHDPLTSPIMHTAHQLKVMLKKSEKIPSSQLFDVLNKASEETLFCSDIRECKERAIFQEKSMTLTLSNVVACISFVLEKKLVQGWSKSKLKAADARKNEGHEKSDEPKQDNVESEGDIAKSGGDSVQRSHDSSDGLHSSDKRIPFEEYVRRHKLTKVFKFRAKSLFKQFRKHLKKFKRKFKLYLNILTRSGRRCARGYLLYIVQMHMTQKCWNGEWDLSDMEVVDGKFIISKEAYLDLTRERAVEDLKRFFDLVLKSNYYNKCLESYPLYFDEFQTDILNLPDPSKQWDKFLLFERFLALHFAFMPPLSRSTLLIHLFKAIEAERYLWSSSSLISKMPKLDWRVHLRGLSYANDVYYHGFDKVAYPNCEPYGPSYFFLLKFCRHFVSHDTDHTRLLVGQLLDDMVLSDLVLGQLLSQHITNLMWLLFKLTKMEKRYFNLFHAFEASDGDVFFCTEDESDDIISEDSSSDEEN